MEINLNFLLRAVWNGCKLKVHEKIRTKKSFFHQLLVTTLIKQSITRKGLSREKEKFRFHELLFQKLVRHNLKASRGRLAQRNTVCFVKNFVFVRGFESRRTPTFLSSAINSHYRFDESLKQVGVVPQPRSRNSKITVEDNNLCVKGNVAR